MRLLAGASKYETEDSLFFCFDDDLSLVEKRGVVPNAKDLCRGAEERVDGGTTRTTGRLVEVVKASQEEAAASKHRAAVNLMVVVAV